MVICFECSRQTKAQLDELVESGSFSDLSEAIAVAVANQILLSKSVSGSQVVGPSTESGARIGAGSPKHASNTAARVPSIFLLTPDIRSEPIAPPAKPARLFSKGEHVSQAQWIFGQHNKLLPAKASCRALANLLAQSPSGVDVAEAARVISSHAANLAAYLQTVDDRFNRVRDETLSTAFPGRSDPDKGRIRYANQFVGGLTKQGQLTGLLFDLGLVNKLSGNGSKFSLTEAGWKFALMPNPVLDGDGQNPTSKFSMEEKTFLGDHVADNVPAERSAYLQILNAVHGGSDSPDKLRGAFNRIEKETAKNTLYFSTQRAGVISRMTDLGLLRRDREGTRVRYGITDEGAAFLNHT